MRKVKSLTEGKIGKHLISLALPILGSSFVQMIYNFTDMAWLGRINNQAAAAVGAVSLFAWLANSFFLITKVGSEVSVAHAIGKKDQAEGATFASQSSSLALLLGIGVALLFIFAAPLLLSVYSLESHIAHLSVSYMNIIGLGIPLIACSASFTGTYNAIGHSRVPFIISSIGLIANMVLDPLFIFVFNWGVQGAGAATVVSQAIVYLLFLRQIKVKDKILNNFSILQPLQSTFVSRLLYIGVPVALLNCCFAIINMLMGRIASQQNGHIGLLTLTTGGQLEGITWYTAQGFATALSAFVSQNYGGNRTDRVIKAVQYTLRIGIAFGLASTLFYYFGGKFLFQLIVPDAKAYLAGADYLRINAYSQLFMMMELCSQGLFYGLRKSHIPAVISIGGNILRLILAYVVLAISPGILTLWWIISVSTMLKGAIALGFLTHQTHKLQQQ